MSKRLTLEEFIQKAISAHGALYDYSKVIYEKANSYINIICPTHGEFSQQAIMHLSGRGCRKCKYDAQSNKMTSSISEFIEKSKSIHGNLYDYSKVDYKNSRTNVEIICSIHGTFFQSPNNHINNSAGCPMCRNEKLSQVRRSNVFEFTKRANSIHGDKYDYSKTEYFTSTDKITVTCPIHGDFTILARDHIHNNRGCQRCNRQENKPESFIKNILDKNNIPYIKNDRTLIKPLELDFVIPTHNLAIEYHGNYFHSQISGEKDNNYHLGKTKRCNDLGINLIQIFEHEFIQTPDIVEAKLKNILNLNKYKIFARKCEVREISYQQKKKFNEKYHIQSDSQSTINLGMFYNNRLIQVMTFSKRRKSLGSKHQEGDYELSRMSSIKGFNVIGGASKLLKYFERNYNPKTLISYADKRWSMGKVYFSMGFKLSHETSPNYWYFHKTNTKKLYHRFKFAKHRLSKQLKEFDPSLSEWVNMKSNGYDRIWDCGNYAFVKTY